MNKTCSTRCDERNKNYCNLLDELISNLDIGREQDGFICVEEVSKK